jgi:putative restriction endonuclease
MDERVPIAVFRQLSDKARHKRGSTYQVLGLGLVTEYSADSDVFFVESVDRQAIEKVTDSITDEVLRYEIQLYTQVMNVFQLFVKEESITYTTTIPKRDKAFRDIVVPEYNFFCAVCKTKFRLNNLIEATAAHIIPKHKDGSDDPRNGLALCRTHHWAFDSGIFTLTDNYEVLLSPLVEQAESHNFTLLEMEKKPILLPSNEIIYPHQEAIKWHRQNIWR